MAVRTRTSTRFTTALAVAAAIAGIAAAVQPAGAAPAPPSTTAAPTTAAPVTDPPVTDPPVTDPPTTEAPATTAPPATDVPASTVPGETSTTATAAVTTTTAVPTGPYISQGSTGVTIKTAVAVDQARKVDASVDEQVAVEAPQSAWNADAAQAILSLKIREAQGRLDAARFGLADAEARLAAAESKLAGLRTREASLEKAASVQVARAAAARQELNRRAVRAFVRGTDSNLIAVATATSPSELQRARQLLTVVADGDRRAADKYQNAVKGLDKKLLALSSQVATAVDGRGVAKRDRDLAANYLDAVQAEWQAYVSGSAVWVKGFVFPVAATVDFIDSWGYPRMSGTSYAHWHQGTDVMAAWGAPLVATENGVIEKLGSASLGGNKVWLAGDSGTAYYYAHLSSYAPGLANGNRICAGQVIGYVGDTGNAQGSDPHVHFEIHPGGAKQPAVNPYPLLKLAFDQQQAYLPLGPLVDPKATCGPPTGVADQANVVPDGALFAPATTTTTAPSAAAATTAPPLRR